MSFPQTPLNDAFNFTSTIKPNQMRASYTQVCIYCSNPTSTALLADGSFRQCLRCKKNFMSQIINQQQQNQNPNQNPNPNQLSQPVSYQTPTFQTMRPIYMPPPSKK